LKWNFWVVMENN